jgi:ribonuclease BN (tRNA processing enzyme)
VGTSGSVPAPGSAASCYLLRTVGDGDGEHRAVLDLGSGALGPLQEYLSPHELDAVLLSHLHPDHSADVSPLHIWVRYHPVAGTVLREAEGPPTERIALHGPCGSLRHLGTVLAQPGPTGEVDPQAKGEDLARTFREEPWQEGRAVRVGPLTVTPLRVSHAGRAYGLRIEQGGGILAYTGDSDLCPALFDVADGADLLLAEATFQEDRDPLRGFHLTGLRAGQLAARARVGRLVLTHLPPWTDPDTVRAEAARAYDGPIDLARPGQNWDI